MPCQIRELARAKVNLTLRVHGRRSDGYHELVSLVTFAEVHDVLRLATGAAVGLEVSGPFASAIDGENLLVKALALLREADPGLLLGSVHLEKRLPVAAGLGSGSADAAALLRAVRRANEARADAIPWLEIAAQLGADVPVCLASRPAVFWGRGERSAAVCSIPALNTVVVNPRVALATAGVFATLRSGQAPAATAAPAPPELADLPALLDYMRAQGNDLEPAAVELLPMISEIKRLIESQADCRLAAMSGSGPTCFGIFSGPASARRAAAEIAAAKPDWWVERTIFAGAP
jgi:4-diphosphocytidyl-2-C-methyl-D-erythritol kinase